MTGRGRQAWAAMWLGALAIASLVFLLPLRELGFVVVPKVAIPVVIVLGLVALKAGWLSSRALIFLAAVSSLLAAVQLGLQTAEAALGQQRVHVRVVAWSGCRTAGARAHKRQDTPTPHDDRQGSRH